MAIAVPRTLVEYILLGPEDDRRQLQDSPILGDVWFQFASEPDAQLELLITPYREQAAGKVATTLAKYIKDGDIAYLQGIVAARLTFEQVLHYVVPLSNWWKEKRIDESISRYVQEPGRFQSELEQILIGYDPRKRTPRVDAAMQDLETHKRYMILAGLILWAGAQSKRRGKPESVFTKAIAPDVVQAVRVFLAGYHGDKDALHAVSEEKPPIWYVSLNRTATPAISKSVSAVKADAARTLFTVNCKDLVWAIVDSGIDATHPAFRNAKGESRVEKAFDFTQIREIVSLDNEDDATANARIKKLLARRLAHDVSAGDVRAHLKQLAADAANGRPVNWGLVEKLIEIDPATPPPTNHGTHVAGILAADRRSLPEGATDGADGMCPDIRLYDFRVLAPSLVETEFAVIAALQYIRFLNENNSYMTIHGANLSLSIRHDVRNYACGRTPVCNECERLLNSGVVVVAAAGNRGYQNFETKDGGVYESYAAFSITDPGNADGVITVGATHRFWPHTYGVSFFSSRGPTGDGRMKPDLLAPGEKIVSCASRDMAPDGGPRPARKKRPASASRQGRYREDSGTSMAAPHVSGSIAAFLSIRNEFIGRPEEVKRIFLTTATDLNRAPYFQGRGLIDLMRAIQSV